MRPNSPPSPLDHIPLVLVLHPVLQVSAVMADIAGHGNPLHGQPSRNADAVRKVAVGIVRNPDDVRGAADGTAFCVLHLLSVPPQFPEPVQQRQQQEKQQQIIWYMGHCVPLLSILLVELHGQRDGKRRSHRRP